jgi:hypothetical protein
VTVGHRDVATQLSWRPAVSQQAGSSCTHLLLLRLRRRIGTAHLRIAASSVAAQLLLVVVAPQGVLVAAVVVGRRALAACSGM